jgi:hypothetical protein
MITFFDLLGIDRAALDRAGIAAGLWPSEEIQPFTGDAFGDTEAYRGLMDYLQGCLELRAVQSGGAGGAVGVSAELHINDTALLGPVPLVLAKMPDVAYFLHPTRTPTGDVPAQLHVTRTGGAVEVVILGLPVRIELPPGFIRPQRDPKDADVVELPDFETTSAPFNAADPDSLRIVLKDFDPSTIFVRIDVRMTPELDFVVDTRVPLTIGPCVFLDLPCEAVHDLQLIPSPRLLREGAVPADWARHVLDAVQLSSTIPGLFTFRAIDIDRTVEPAAELLKRISTTRPAPAGSTDPPERNEIEPIIEDIAFPAFMAPLPVPAHFRLGLRKVLFDLNAPFGEEYNLDTAPIDIPIRDWHLKIFRFFVQSVGESLPDGEPHAGEPQTFATINAVLVAGEDPANSWSFGLDYTDEGLLTATAIVPIEDRVRLFTILNREVRVLGLKLGYSLFEPDPRRIHARPAFVIPLGDLGWANRLILLADFEIKKIAKENPFSISDKANKDEPSILHDVGWYLGGISVGAIYDPDGLELKAFDRFRIEIEEIAVVSATNGATYLMLSAGIDFGIGKPARSDDRPQAGEAPPSAGGQEAVERGGGIHFHRLKFRMGDQNDQAADVLLDGISLSLRTERLKLEGFGMISEHFLGATRLRELAFALKAELRACKRQFTLGLGFFYGTASGGESFTYWMFNLVVGGVPLGSATLENVRVLVAGNMRPRLPPPDGNPNPFRLFRWYKQNGDAISLPLNRQLTSWERFDDSFALGAGARIKLGGVDTVTLDAFFFYHDSPDEEGFLAALEVYLGKGEKPIAFGVLEADLERGSSHIQIGINLGLDNVLGKPDLPTALKRLATLTGTLMAGNNIDYVAIGVFTDPASWLSVRFAWPHGWRAEIWAALCYHHVDAEDGPHVFALSVGAKGTLDIGIGSLKLYATATLVAGRWRNEAVATGVVIDVEAGVRIRVFRIINFGAVIEIETDWLGGPPRYTRHSFTFRIETPWWLPDVSVRFECTKGSPQLAGQEVASCPLIAASALPPATRAPAAIGVTPLVGPSVVPTAVFHLDQLRATGPAVVPGAAFDGLVPVPVDSRIALDFKSGLEAPVTVVPDTPDGAGTQKSGELTLGYELVEIGIRRRKRFGPDAGVWIDLLTPETTRIDSPDDLTALFSSAVRFEWDVDVVRAGRTDTRRLLVNADTAYTLSGYNPDGDDIADTTFPGWPCCHPTRKPRPFHEVAFEGFAFGSRAPASQRFTDSRSTFNWQGGLPPVVGPPSQAPPGSVPVFVHVASRPAGPIAVASFDERVAACQVFASWAPGQSNSVLAVEAFDGLTLVSSRKLQLAAAPPPAIVIDTPKGMTSLLIRKLGSVESKEADVELVRVRYRTVREVLADAIRETKCKLGEGRVHGSGVLAWLPNRDYEVTVRVRVSLDHERNGTQDATVEQKAFFRTKGLPGLNAVARVGDEIEPYVESRYPGPGAARLYRREPLAVAFSERFNILAPVNRGPATSEEAAQILEWVLAVEKVGGVLGFERISQTAEDWVMAHRGAVPPIPPRRPAILDAAVFTSGERSAPSLEPLVVRYEAMMRRPGGCTDPGDGLHPSQVLVHAPVDPGAAPDAAPRWEADQELRVNLRQKAAPFVDRPTFDPLDASAFTRSAASGPAASWRSDGGAMCVDADPQPPAAQYAVFGESDWRHVQVETVVDPAGGEAGIAVAVSGSRGVEALLSSAGQLRLIERDGAAIRPLADAVEVPAGEGPARLEVIAYDDRVRATVGDRTIEGPLGAIREGRLALVSRGGGRFTRLHVGGLDAWRFHCRTSRYDDFPAHVESWDRVLGALRPGDFGAATRTVAQLLAQTAAEIPPVMNGRADAERRQRLFEVWTAGLALPLREDPRILALTRWVEDDVTSLILLESDEPLPFSRDVSLLLSRRTKKRPFPEPVPDLELDDDRLTAPSLPPRARLARRILRAVIGENGRLEAEVFEIERSLDGTLRARRIRGRVAWPSGLGVPEPGTLLFVDEENRPVLPPIPPLDVLVWSPIPTVVLTNGDETCALIVPSGGPLAAGRFRLRFQVDRPRWRAAAPDATSNYRATATLPLEWT